MFSDYFVNEINVVLQVCAAGFCVSSENAPLLSGKCHRRRKRGGGGPNNLSGGRQHTL